MRLAMGVFVAAVMAAPILANAQTVTKTEPPLGMMRSSEVAYVDNGKCPKGQVMRVTSGTMGASGARGTGGKAMPRERSCVPRPQ